MTSSVHTPSDSQRYDMARRVTREQALDVAQNLS